MLGCRGREDIGASKDGRVYKGPGPSIHASALHYVRRLPYIMSMENTKDNLCDSFGKQLDSFAD